MLHNSGNIYFLSQYAYIWRETNSFEGQKKQNATEKKGKTEQWPVEPKKIKKTKRKEGEALVRYSRRYISKRMRLCTKNLKNGTTLAKKWKKNSKMYSFC